MACCSGLARPVDGAEVLDLVVLGGVLGTVECGRPRRTELRRAVERERLDVGDPGERVADLVGWGRTPLTWLIANGMGERDVATVVGSCRQHRRRGGGPNGNPVRLVGAVGNRRQRLFVQTIDPSHHGLRHRWIGAQSDEHVVGCGCHCCIQ